MNGREQNDIYFSVLLPVKKRDVVKSRYITVIIIEIVQILIAIPVGILRYAIIPENNQAGIEANVAFYGLVLIMYALFNIIFLNRFYKAPDKIGGPFLLASVVQFLYIGVAEALVLALTPLKEYLDTIDSNMMIKQLPILLGGIAIYVLITFISYRSSKKSFEKIDL